MSVVSLAEWKKAREPYLEGPAKCLGCGHEWIAVAPLETETMECPACNLQKGIWAGLYNPPGDQHIWECKCGNQYFFWVESGNLFCPQCGTTQEPD